MLLIVDIDLTVADCSKRVNKAGAPPADRTDTAAFNKWLTKLQNPEDMLKDRVVPEVFELVNSIRGQLSPVRLVYLTSRDRSYYDVTKQWLDQNGFFDGPIIMREVGDGASYGGFKEEVLKRLVKQNKGHNVIVIDDHPEMSDVCVKHGWLHLRPRFKTEKKLNEAAAWGSTNKTPIFNSAYYYVAVGVAASLTLAAGLLL